MKRLMSVLFIAILFASCSSDDDSSFANSIVGVWTLTEANLELPQDFNNDGTVDSNFKNEVPCFESTTAFTADGTYTQSFSNVEAVELNGETTYVCNGSTNTSGTYVLDGNQLTTTTSGSTPEVTTTTIDLSGNTLKATLPFGIYGDVEFVYTRN